MPNSPIGFDSEMRIMLRLDSASAENVNSEGLSFKQSSKLLGCHCNAKLKLCGGWLGRYEMGVFVGGARDRSQRPVSRGT